MNYGNYISLKSSGIVGFSKKTKSFGSETVEYIELSQKSFNPNTGAEEAVNTSEVTQANLEREKSKLDDRIAIMQKESDGLKQAITDIKAL
jgi:hypothetical protein|tara:strand:+ start:69 stop:341 length:273 start_codon:yes stop_codon:yes gene_type:complete